MSTPEQEIAHARAALEQMSVEEIDAKLALGGAWKSRRMQKLALEARAAKLKAAAEERSRVDAERHREVIGASGNEASATREGNRINLVFGWGGWVLAFAQFAWDVGRWALT